MWKRITVVLLLVLLPLTAGNAAAVSGLQNDEIPGSVDDLFDISRHGIPVAGWIIMGVLFILVAIGLYLVTGSIGTFVSILIGALGILFVFYGVIPNLTSIMLGFVLSGIVLAYFLVATGTVSFGI